MNPGGARVQRCGLAVFAGLLLLCVLPALAAPITLQPFTYRYDVAWGSFGVGTLTLTLQAQPDHPGCYRYSTVTQPNALVRMFYGAPSQQSDFCIDDGHVRSENFVSTLPGDEDQSYSLHFDWDKHQVIDGHGKARDIPDDAVDSLSLQQAVRLWVLAHPKAQADHDDPSKSPEARFTMVDDKHLTHYRFRFAGRTGVDTPAGHFDAVLMERVDSPDRVGRFWLAPARDYMAVKSETRIGGKPAVTMVLDRYPQ